MGTPSERPDGLGRLWGVYHADGGLLGEVAYVVGKLTGTAHCALCDITHGLRMKPEWRAFTESLEVPFELVRLDEQPSPFASVTEGRMPCVAAQARGGGFEMLPGPEALESVEGSVEVFAALLDEARSG